MRTHRREYGLTSWSDREKKTAKNRDHGLKEKTRYGLENQWGEKFSVNLKLTSFCGGRNFKPSAMKGGIASSNLSIKKSAISAFSLVGQKKEREGNCSQRENGKGFTGPESRNKKKEKMSS